ncbi:hypothetical protein NDU88_005285 [Pleurodeles waltl]|uniref:Uncharacterized protein n=1 Tax=Pleurodeles waltl TaxID=8319 RepID=A0AAV7UHN5_PLEWA|nr:hypothetical protein NDU88_005285 [Pleurodeles waltl]
MQAIADNYHLFQPRSFVRSSRQAPPRQPDPGARRSHGLVIHPMGHSPTLQSSFRVRGRPPVRARYLLLGIDCAPKCPVVPWSPHVGQQVRSRAHLPQGATHGAPRPTSGPPQVIHSASPLTTSPFLEGAQRGGVPPGPPIPPNRIRVSGSSIRSCAANVSAAALGPPASFPPRPAALHQAVASSEGRSRKPPLATVKSASNVGADEPGSPASFPQRPAAPRQAAASSEGRGRTPPLATGQIVRLAARPRTALGAQSCLPVIRRKVPTLCEQAARTSALKRIIPAGPSGARKSGVRHVPDPGHAPTIAPLIIVLLFRKQRYSSTL